MTFEGFDAALPIESGGLSPPIAGALIAPAAAGELTLEAALREAGFGAGRAALDAPDLWAARAGSHAARIAEQATLAVLARGWALFDGDSAPDAPPAAGGKPLVLRAAYDDVDGDGHEDPPIVVTANTVNEGTGDQNGGGYDGGFYPGLPGYGGELGDGSSLDDPNEPNDCRDRKAIAAQSEINNDPNKNHYEHGSIVYRDATGAVRHTPPMQGGTHEIPRSLILSTMQLHGISFSQIIGFVHNHPIDSYSTSTAENRYPSGGDAPGRDWDGADWFVNNGAGGNGGENFALYIIDTDGVMREFKYSDRDMFKNLDAEERRNNENLPGRVRSDGSSCG